MIYDIILIFVILILLILLYIHCVICRANIDIALNCNVSNSIEYFTVRSTSKRTHEQYYLTIQTIKDFIIYTILLYFVVRFGNYIINNYKTFDIMNLDIRVEDVILFIILILILSDYCGKLYNDRDRYENLRIKFNNNMDNYCMRDDMIKNMKYIHEDLNEDGLFNKYYDSSNLFDYVNSKSVWNDDKYSCFMNEEFSTYSDIMKNNSLDFDNYKSDVNYKIMRGYTDELYGNYIINEYHMIDIISIFIVLLIYIILGYLLPITGHMPLGITIVILIIIILYFFDILYKVR
jgi:hypothetical protein